MSVSLDDCSPREIFFTWVLSRHWDVSYVEHLEGSQFAHVLVEICYRLRKKFDNFMLAHDNNLL